MKIGDIVLICCIIKEIEETDFEYIGKIGKVIKVKLEDFDMLVEFNDKETARFFKNEVIKIKTL